ncbi:MAG: suppressor of fused domain protein [Alphaproteobacteria bacterium]|nr:suppressor of fused domain protein [Alphaproteobacteria bacterium]
MEPLNEKAIARHLERFFGKSKHALFATGDGVHVYIYPPNRHRSFQTLVTMGLSGFEMPVPESQKKREEFLHVELLTRVPEDWPIPRATGEAGFWPYAMLSSLAEYAAQQKVWLGPLHVVPNLTSTPYGKPFEKGSLLSHALLLPPAQENAEFARLKIKGKTVRFLQVIPITSAECSEMDRKGFFESIVHFLDDGKIPAVIDPKRPSAV